jgi:hypothetical protein
VQFQKRVSRDLLVVVAIIVIVVVLVGYVIDALVPLATSGASLLAVVGIAALLIFAAIIALCLLVSFFY